MDPNLNLKFAGRVWHASAFGVADVKIGLHIQDGIAPFRVELKVNGNLARIVENIPDALTPADDDYQCIIENLPAGVYSLVITDSTQPEPQDVRGFSCYNAVSPPYATLNGSVNPMGSQTMVSFEYGETSEYGKEAQFGIVNGFAPTIASLQLSAAIQGVNNPTEFLLPGTLYHFRIKAVNDNGTSYGDDMTFMTPSLVAAPIAVTLPATNIS